MVDYDKVPVQYMKEGVRNYIEHGIDPGSFLSYVIENNFAMAVVKADCENKQHLHEWALFFLNEVPLSAWGSKETKEDWMWNARETRKNVAK